MGNCQFDAQCFRLNILALDPASTRAPTKPCRIIRPTTFPKVCSTQLRSAQCMFKWFQWVWPRPGHIISKIFKSKTRKFMILYIFGCLKYLYHSDSGGGLPVSTWWTNNFLRLFLVLFFVVTLPGSVGGGLGCGQWTCREPQHPDLSPSAECSQHARQPLLSQHSTTSQLQTTNFQLYKEPFRGWVKRLHTWKMMSLYFWETNISLQLKC